MENIYQNRSQTEIFNKKMVKENAELSSFTSQSSYIYINRSNNEYEAFIRYVLPIYSHQFSIHIGGHSTRYFATAKVKSRMLLDITKVRGPDLPVYEETLESQNFDKHRVLDLGDEKTLPFGRRQCLHLATAVERSGQKNRFIY